MFLFEKIKCRNPNDRHCPFRKLLYLAFERVI